MSGERGRLVAGALAVAALGVFVALRLDVSNDITAFLPSGAPDSDVTVARSLAAGAASRAIVLVVEARDDEHALAASLELERALREEPRVAGALASLEFGPPAGLDEALWALYRPRRFMMVPERPVDVGARLASPGLARAAAHLRQRLALPLSPLVGRIAPEDPLLILPALFERLGSHAERVRVESGRFLTREGHGAVAFLGASADAFDAGAQGPLLDGIQAAFDAVDAAHGGALQLQVSGAARFAAQAEDSIRTDVRRVGLGSLVGLALMLFGIFRSPRLVVVTLPVLGAAFLCGLATCLLAFGRVHGITLAFGAALVGVSVDYAVHVHCHQALAPASAGPRATLRRVWPGLVLGASTTIAGFVALLASDFPGMRELAVFAASGIVAALAATWAFLPGLVARDARPAPVALALALAMRDATARLARHRRALAIVLIAISAAVLPLARHAVWNDDVADLSRRDAELLREDDAVRARVASYEPGRLVVALGDDEESALQVNDRVAEQLMAAQQQGEIGGHWGLGTLLPSARLQRERDAAFRADPTLWPRLREALEREGFVAGAFEPFASSLSESPPAPLRLSDLEGTALAALVRPFLVEVGTRVGVVTLLHDLRDADALSDRLASAPGARLIDIRGVLSQAYGAYRERMTVLLLAGLVGVLALVGARHRSPRAILSVCGPALLAAGATVAVLAASGVPLNMLSLVALLMVVSMGVDYGVFLAEARGDDEMCATHLGVFVSALSTVLGFGLLAFSEQPALRGIGLTSTVGIATCLVLAPAMRVFARPSPTEDAP